jgi:hypothetical protein
MVPKELLTYLKYGINNLKRNNMEQTLTATDYLIAAQIIQGIHQDIQLVTHILR